MEHGAGDLGPTLGVHESTRHLQERRQHSGCVVSSCYFLLFNVSMVQLLRFFQFFIFQFCILYFSMFQCFIFHQYILDGQQEGQHWWCKCTCQSVSNLPASGCWSWSCCWVWGQKDNQSWSDTGCVWGLGWCCQCTSAHSS